MEDIFNRRIAELLHEARTNPLAGKGFEAENERLLKKWGKRLEGLPAETEDQKHIRVITAHLFENQHNYMASFGESYEGSKVE